MADELHRIDSEPDKTTGIDAEYLSGRRYDYQEDRASSADVDLLAGTPGGDINWLEDVEMLTEDGIPAVFDRYTNAFLKIYFPLPDEPPSATRSRARCCCCTCSPATRTASS